MSKNVLRVIRISKKYNQRPSEVIGIKDDTYLAFCFDEACEYIMSHKKVRYDSKGKGEEYWDTKPKWLDEVKEKKRNNLDLINEMESSLEKYKQGGNN